MFIAFYYFNIGFFSITSPTSSNYNSVIDHNFNYIKLLRHGLLNCSSSLVGLLGYTTIINDYEMLVVGRGSIRLVYSCLGLGIMSFFAAFVLAYPKATREKIIFLICGLVVIQILNILRIVTVALFWDRHARHILDHHVIFNGIIYIIVAVALYFWVTDDDRKKHAKN